MHCILKRLLAVWRAALCVLSSVAAVIASNWGKAMLKLVSPAKENRIKNSKTTIFTAGSVKA